MAGRGGADWFEREEFIGQISDIRVQNLQVEREVVQKRTFTRWMNLHLEKASPPLQVQDLFQDIQDGHILMVLLEELSGCSLVQGFRKSSHRIFRLNNIAKVLSFLEERNVKLVSIDAADVADGNSSIILGLIWNIILFFQIKELTGNIRSQFPSSCSLSSVPTSWDSGADAPSEERRSGAVMENHKAIRKLLQWVQRRTRKYGVAVQDFGRSWTSGLAFLALIKSIDSSLVDMRKALLRSPRDNLEDAFRTAHFSLGIPRLLEPEDVAVSAPDEQSFIMYVSQFLEHFPDIQQPEDNHRPVERSISMERLNLRDASLEDLQHRPHMFQRDQPHPKVWISSASEDRSVTTPRLRTHAARSWSTEDFLSSSTHTDVSRDVVEQLGFQSPSSLACDSAISSPDSWVDGDLLPESQGDGSLWEVYRATPVDVMPLDEGFLSSMEDRAPDEPSTPGSYVEELENIHRPSGDNQGLKVHETNLENQDQILELDPGTDLTSDPTDTNITEERDMDVRQLQKHSKPCSEDMTSPSQEDFLEQHFTSVIRASPHLEDPGQTPHLEDPGQNPHLEDPGQNPHLEDPGQTRHLEDPGQTPHLEDPGQTPHLEDPGQTPHLEDPGQNPHLEDPGQNPHLEDPGQNPHLEDPGQTPHLEDPGQNPHLEDPGQNPHLEDPGQTRHLEDPGQTPHLEDPGQTPHLEDPGQTPHLEDPGQNPHLEDPGQNPHLEDPGQNPHLEDPGQTPHLEDPGQNPHLEDPGQTPHLEDPGQNPHLEDPGQNPHLEDPGQNPHLEDPGQTPHLQKKTDSEQLGCQEMISPSEDKRPSRNEPETSKERKDGVDMQDEELTGDIQISGRTSSTEATDQSSLSIPLISIWDSDDQVEDRVHEPGPPDTDLEDRVSKLDQGEIAAQQRSYDCEGTTEDVSGPQDPDGLSHIWDEDVLVYIKPRPEQPMILEYLDDVDEAEPESLSAPDDPQTRMDLNKTTLDHDGPNGPADGDQDTRTNGSSDMETRNSHHMSGPNTSQPTDQSLSRTVDLFYSDSGRGTPTEDLLGDPVEPMDLFYPDKEEPVFTESADTEMQRWPSVLSVSALQPAPASDDSAEVQKPDLLGDIFAGLEETDNVTRQTNQEPTDTPASQDQCVMCGVAIRGPAGELPRPESPEDSREVQDSISRHRGSSSTAEIQVQPVLLPRKGVCLSEPLFSLRAASGTSDPPTDLWNWELRLLLLLWLLLYLLWLLPQVDLYQLLLNLEP